MPVAKVGKLGPLAEVGGPPPGLVGRAGRQRADWPITAREERAGEVLRLGPEDWREKEAWPRDVDFLGHSGISLPQRRVIWYLLFGPPKMVAGVDFTIECPLFGEFGQALSYLPDVMLLKVHPAGIVGWEMQGEYWHDKFFQRYNDEVRRQRLLQMSAYGLPFVAVLFLWERDINQSDERRDEICELALRGIEIQW